MTTLSELNSLALLKKLVSEAGGKPVNLIADSMWENSVDVRISFDPAKATQDMMLSGSTRSDKAKSIKAKFEKCYKNKIAIVQLDNKGEFGMTVKVAAKMDFDGFDTKKLHFYSYDEDSNTYRRIPDPVYYIDQNGFLHFYTFYGGTIVISDGPLEKR